MPLVGIKGGGLPGQDSTAISTSQRHPLGTVAIDSSGGEYLYCRGSTAVSTIVAGDWVSYHSTAGGVGAEFHMARIPVSTIGATGRLFLGIAMAAVDSTANFGWVQVSGRSSIAHMDSTTQDGFTKVHLSSAQAGTLTTSTGGTQVFNAMTLSSGTSSLCNVWMNYPFIMSTLAGA